VKQLSLEKVKTSSGRGDAWTERNRGVDLATCKQVREFLAALDGVSPPDPRTLHGSPGKCTWPRRRVLLAVPVPDGVSRSTSLYLGVQYKIAVVSSQPPEVAKSGVRDSSVQLGAQHHWNPAAIDGLSGAVAGQAVSGAETVPGSHLACSLWSHIQTSRCNSKRMVLQRCRGLERTKLLLGRDGVPIRVSDVVERKLRERERACFFWVFLHSAKKVSDHQVRRYKVRLGNRKKTPHWNVSVKRKRKPSSPRSQPQRPLLGCIVRHRAHYCDNQFGFEFTCTGE